MQVDQFGTSDYDLSTASDWPFLDSVVIMGDELTGVCGPLTVTIYHTGTTNVATFVDFNP